jgi:hypothetical protein
LKDADNSTLLDNVDFCDIKNIPVSFMNVMYNKTLNVDYIHAMMWRWTPLYDSYVDVFSSRDSDSHIIQREVDSVNVWLKSDNIGHIMRDHFYHRFLILGGLWVCIFVNVFTKLCIR